MAFQSALLSAAAADEDVRGPPILGKCSQFEKIPRHRNMETRDIEHPTSNEGWELRCWMFDVGCSALDVRRWMLPLPQSPRPRASTAVFRLNGPMPDGPIIQLNRLSKHFGGVTALDGVSFDIPGGEVHAVVGENGAGKSTLMKLLAGVHEPDDGEIRIEGRSVRLKNPREARHQGISIVFQELNLFPHRTVAANVFANREVSRRWGWVNRRAMCEATRRVLCELNVRLSPSALVGPLAKIGRAHV